MPHLYVVHRVNFGHVANEGRDARNAVELVAELEFVWNQIKSNSPSSSASSPKAADILDTSPRRFAQPLSGADGPMKVLSPMSEEDEAEHDYQRRMGDNDGDEDDEYIKRGDKWSKKMERAIVRLSAEVAALREQITTGREWRAKKERSLSARSGWFAWLITKHLLVDTIILGIVLLWMRRRKDRRLEDHVRAALRIAREYIRKILPSR